MNKQNENISLKKVSEFLRECPEDDGTFKGCLYNLYFIMNIFKSVDNIENGNAMTLEESKERMRLKYANYSKRYGS